VEKIVSRKANQGPLSEELYIMLQELRMGKTRREALRDMARRVSLDTLNSVVASLVQADQLGTPLGPILRIQADMLRIRRSQEAEKAAMEAAVKLLFPLLFIFISVMLILLGPMFLRLSDTLV
jgi:tight adherence protein C